MGILWIVLWSSVGLIVWTHAGYPLAAAAGARLRRYRPRRDDGYVPSVALIVVAHNEEHVIARRLENALALDYPADRLEVVVTSDGSTDGTRGEVERFAGRGVRLVANPRVGKTAAQNAAVRETSSEVLAFSDANSIWEPDALRLLVRNLADPEVGYVCGRLRLEGPTTEGLYWRYELWLRAQESRLGSITAGNGAIYAVRRSAYLELGPQYSHDIAFPFRLRRLGLRSVYEPAAVGHEPAAASTGAEWGRKVRMLSRSWWDTVRGGMLDPRRQGIVYYVELLSHRLLRYASGLLHLALLGSSAALASSSRLAQVLLAVQLGWLLLAAAGWRWSGRVPLSGLAWYYLVVTAASIASLLRVLRHGPALTWMPAEGTRERRRLDGAAPESGSAGFAGATAGMSGRGYEAARRALDLVVAVVGIVVTSPFLLATALTIKLESRGPVIFRQERVGRHGRSFQILKFRTMVEGAHLLGPGYLTSKGDPRITRVGAFLRRWSLDELPQLFNILRGDMSVIGPRPTLRYQVDKYTDFQRRRLEVLPGVTGWAQIRGRNGLTWPERIELDVWYVDHRSLALDLRILMKTLAVISKPDEVYNEQRADWGENLERPRRHARD